MEYSGTVSPWVLAWAPSNSAIKAELSSKNFVFIQDNPSKPKTSSRRAADFVARGLAVRVSVDTIRMLTRPEVIVSRGTMAAMERDRQYWTSVARQRGGQQVSFIWGKATTPVENSEPWSRRLGTVGRSARVVVGR